MRAQASLKFGGPVRELPQVSERTQRMNIREGVSTLEVSRKAFHFRTVNDARLASWKAVTYEMDFVNPGGPSSLDQQSDNGT